MKPEDRILFACVRQEFNREYQQTTVELAQRTSLNWDQVFAKAEQHGVAGLVYVNLCQRSSHDLGIPAATGEHYRMYTLRNTVHKEQQLQRLNQALDYLAAQSIQAMIIKGVALDVLVYEHSAYTTINDIDLVLNIRKNALSTDALYELMRQLPGGLEYDFYEHHDVTINGALPVDFRQIWQDATSLEYKGHKVWLMCPEDMFISLCINSCRKRFFRLKSLLDIAETIRKIPGIQWEKVLEKISRYDCANIMYTALLITSQSIGCSLPEGFLDHLPVSSARKALINGMVEYAMRFGTLPAAPISGKMVLGKQIHISLLLPYVAYRPYQVRHRFMEEVFYKERAQEIT